MINYTSYQTINYNIFPYDSVLKMTETLRSLNVCVSKLQSDFYAHPGTTYITRISWIIDVKLLKLSVSVIIRYTYIILTCKIITDNGEIVPYQW